MEGEERGSIQGVSVGVACTTDLPSVLHSLI